MIGVEIDNDFNILFGNNNQKGILFVQNNNMQHWKILLTAPKGSFYRDLNIGIDYYLLLNLARLDNIEGFKNYFMHYAYDNHIDLLNVDFFYNGSDLIVNFYFSQGMQTAKIG